MSDYRYVAVLNAMNYPCHELNGAYVWDGDTPPEGLVALVESLPLDQNALYSLDPLTDSRLLAISGLVSGTRWDLLKAWLCDKLCDAQGAVIQANPHVLAHLMKKLFVDPDIGVRLNSAKQQAKAALNAVGLTEL